MNVRAIWLSQRHGHSFDLVYRTSNESILARAFPARSLPFSLLLSLLPGGANSIPRSRHSFPFNLSSSPATHWPSSVNSISVSPANPYPYLFVDESHLSPSFVLSENERSVFLFWVHRGVEEFFFGVVEKDREMAMIFVRNGNWVRSALLGGR